MGAALKSGPSDRAVPSLPHYLFVRWLACIPAFFVILVVWAIIEPTAGKVRLHRPWASGPHFWTVAVIAAIMAATYTIPGCLRGWYDLKRVRAGRSSAGIGLGWILYFTVLLTVLMRSSVWVMTDPDARATIFPLCWNQTQGRLVSYKPGGGTEEAFVADVIYTYTVDGRMYTSSEVSRAGVVPFSVAQQWKKQAGKPITVYYDSAAPGVSVLAPAINPGYRSWVLIQLSLCVFVALMAARGFRWSYYREKSPEANLPSNGQLSNNEPQPK